MTGPDASSSELMVAVQAAIVDRATARVVTALRDEGVRSILLKGPVLADWLYADSPRAYLDADLLVAPADVSRAEAVLDGLGYAKVLGDADIPPFNRQLHAQHLVPTARDLDRSAPHPGRRAGDSGDGVGGTRSGRRDGGGRWDGGRGPGAEAAP